MFVKCGQIVCSIIQGFETKVKKGRDEQKQWWLGPQGRNRWACIKWTIMQGQVWKPIKLQNRSVRIHLIIQQRQRATEKGGGIYKRK